MSISYKEDFTKHKQFCITDSWGFYYIANNSLIMDLKRTNTMSSKTQASNTLLFRITTQCHASAFQHLLSYSQ